MADDRAARRFYAWRTDHPHQAEDPALAWAAAWKVSGAYHIRRTARLAEIAPVLIELLAALRDDDLSDEIEAELAETAAYWTSER